jgi:hypothetical protein
MQYNIFIIRNVIILIDRLLKYWESNRIKNNSFTFKGYFFTKKGINIRNLIFVIENLFPTNYMLLIFAYAARCPCSAGSFSLVKSIMKNEHFPNYSVTRD